MVEKVLFWDQNFGVEILMDLHDLKALESETNYSRNFKFDILRLYHT